MDKRPVVILDFGGQYSRLIARRIRELKLWSEILPWNASVEQIAAHNPQALILSGGPASVYSEDAPTLNPGVLDRGWPVLGICYGMQSLVKLAGGTVQRAPKREYGVMPVDFDEHPLFAGLEHPFRALMSHSDFISQAPDGFRTIAATASTPVAAIADDERKIYGVQFHPEVAHTGQGAELLGNFLFKLCGLKENWSMADYITETVAAIQDQIGDNPVICGLSGGVDSAVSAALVHRAVGDQLTCFFVDHGLLRHNEAEEVMYTFADKGIKILKIDARERFLTALSGLIDPEAKRKAIGTQFIREFEATARKLGDAKFLVQGTVYPDVVESGSGGSQTIKSHHNVGGLPEDMEFELCEPVRELFKDEVREVGSRLGLPDEIVWRQPFPGPGLGIRVLGEVTAERLEIVRAADAIVREEIAAAGLDREVWQYFAVLPGVQSVGVMGDARTYQELVAVRAVTSVDGMTADWARIPWPVLERISQRIVNEVDHVNRVVYDITGKPPGTIEWE
ncbi:MAG: glutamine-hydrolyzing GMP synthase [Firmicutes bacterium]|nr:glutamine-hydrolyzing GMP synthase [Bacillota bacterium]